jgi:flagellar hook-length control protein FliK
VPTTPAQVVGGAAPGAFAQQLARQRAGDTPRAAAAPTSASERPAGPSRADVPSTTAPDEVSDASDADDAGERVDKKDDTAPDCTVDALLSRLAAADGLPTPAEVRPASGSTLLNRGSKPGEPGGPSRKDGQGKGATDEAEAPGQRSATAVLAQVAAAAGRAAADSNAGVAVTSKLQTQAEAPAPALAQAQAPISNGQALALDALQRGAGETAGERAAQLSGAGLAGSGGSNSSAALAAALAVSTPAGAAPGAGAAPLPEARLGAPPGHADFAPQLGAQISLFVRDGVQQARLHLNPAEMGPITVQIRLDGGGAQVHLAADNALTRQALEQAMPTLAGSLREAGMTLTGGGVFERPSDQPGQPGQTGQSGQGGAGDQARARAGQRPAGRHEADGYPSSMAATLPTPMRRGVVDLVA